MLSSDWMKTQLRRGRRKMEKLSTESTMNWEREREKKKLNYIRHTPGTLNKALIILQVFPIQSEKLIF